MKNNLAGCSSVFMITALITHIWTVIIAFSEGGFWAGVVSLFLPVLSEIFWAFKMLGANTIYSLVAFAHIAMAFLFQLVSKNN